MECSEAEAVVVGFVLALPLKVTHSLTVSAVAAVVVAVVSVVADAALQYTQEHLRACVMLVEKHQEMVAAFCEAPAVSDRPAVLPV